MFCKIYKLTILFFTFIYRIKIVRLWDGKIIEVEKEDSDEENNSSEQNS